MKKLFLFLTVLPVFCGAQTHSCCSTTSTEKFAMLSENEAFVSFHLNPLPLNFTAEKGKMITFDCDDGKKGNAFEVKSDSASDKWLIVVHEFWGLNDYIKREAETLAGELPGLNVLAIDLYDGQVTDVREKAVEIMESVKENRARSIIDGAIKYAGPNAKIGTIGWCFGGGWSLQASLMAGKQAVACVIYYGYPETDTSKLSQLNAGVLGIFATEDKWITPEVVKTFEENMKAAGKKIVVKNFAADHAFANPSNPNYDKVAAGTAHSLAVGFLRSKLR